MTETETTVNKTETRTVDRDRWVDAGGWFVGLAAAVSSWTGWVGLAHKCGWTETWTLPVTETKVQLAWLAAAMVDVYAVVAFRVWLRSAGWVSLATREYARKSTFLAIGLGVGGNASYYLMETWKVGKAPWWLVVLFSSLAPIVLGLICHLISILGKDQITAETAPIQVSPVKKQVKTETKTARPVTETARPTIETETQAPKVSPSVSLPSPRPETAKVETETRTGQTETRETTTVSSLPARSQSRAEQLEAIKEAVPTWREIGGEVSNAKLTEITGITGKQTLTNLRKFLREEATQQDSAPELVNAG